VKGEKKELININRREPAMWLVFGVDGGSRRSLDDARDDKRRMSSRLSEAHGEIFPRWSR